MTTCKAIIFTLCYIILILFVHIIVVGPSETTNIITYEDKILIGDKLIERKQLERLVNTITSSPKTEAFAKRFGIEIIPAPPEILLQINHTAEPVYDVDPARKDKNYVDPLLTNMIEEVEEFFQEKPGLAHQALRSYQRNKRSKEFWAKVKNYVKEH